MNQLSEPMAPAQRTPLASRGIAAWALVQVGLFLWKVVKIVPLPFVLMLNAVPLGPPIPFFVVPSSIGILITMIERRFHWRATLAGLATMMLGFAVLGLVVFEPTVAHGVELIINRMLNGLGMSSAFGPFTLHSNRDLVLWGGAMLVMTLAGFVIGRIGKRVGVWEIFQATLIVFVLVWVHMQKGWDVLLGFGPSDSSDFLAYVTDLPPGERLLGNLWDRILVLAGVAGILMASFGGSLAFLFFSEGRSDLRFGFERVVGVRHMLAQRVSATAVVAVVGVALGVATLLSVTAVMSGYQNDIQTKILSTNAHFVIQKYGIDFTEHDKITSEALKDEQVLAATPFTFNEAMLSTGERGVGVLIKGVIPSDAGHVTGIEGNLCERFAPETGRCDYFQDAAVRLPGLLATEHGVPSLIVGSELLKRLKLPVGSHVVLTTPVGIAGARGNAPRRMEFRVTGAFRSGMHDFDVRLVYSDLAASQQLMGLGAAVSGVEFKVKNFEEADETAERVLRAVGHYPYRKLDWRKLNEGIFTALKLQKIMMFLILTGMVIVGAFNIASTLFMAVIAKARDIAVLKSMGARDASIMKIFVLEGWLVGGLGTGLGIMLGLAICAILSELHIEIAADVYMVGSLQVRVRPFEVAFTAAAAMIISHLATIYPALNAARQRPVDAMRYE